MLTVYQLPNLLDHGLSALQLLCYCVSLLDVGPGLQPFWFFMECQIPMQPPVSATLASIAHDHENQSVLI